MLSDWLVVAIFMIIIIVMKSSFPEPHRQLYKKDLGPEPPFQKPRAKGPSRRAGSPLCPLQLCTFNATPLKGGFLQNRTIATKFGLWLPGP